GPAFGPRIGRAARALLGGCRNVARIADRVAEPAVLAAKQVAGVARGELQPDLCPVPQDGGAAGEPPPRDARGETGGQHECAADQDRPSHQAAPSRAASGGRRASVRVSRMAAPSRTLPPSRTQASDRRSLVHHTSKQTVAIIAVIANANVLRRSDSLAS